MRGLGSIFVGLGAFAAVTAAFLLAMTLMVSGPPTWSEMRGLSEISSSAMRDLGAIGRRVAGLLDAPDAEEPAPETIAPREEKSEPARRLAKVAPQRVETRQGARAPRAQRRQERRTEPTRRAERLAPPRRAEAAPLARNPVWLMRELDRREAPSAPRIEPDPEPPAEAPVYQDDPPPDEGEIHEGEIYEENWPMSEEEYYREFEREQAERRDRWRWR